MKPYIPNDLPLSDLDYKRLLALVGSASEELARYDGLLQGIPNPAVMLSPLTTQEAVLSSKIEGTQATVDEVLEQDAGLVKDGEKEKDIQEILNYRSALREAYDYLQERPVRLSFIRQLHKILLDSVRGHNKQPGEFRKEQNWIGSPGCAIEEATFVPPDPIQLPSYLDAFENYIDTQDIDALLQAAVVHAQFELLHPFMDGNGRIGRILIPLFLFQKRKLAQPMFYLSEYLEGNREEYYSRLRAISGEGDWNGWIGFFLKAITAQARENNRRVRKIMNLYEEMKTQIQAITHSQYTVTLLDQLFSNPTFRTTDFVARTGINKQTAMSLLRQLRSRNILEILKDGSGRRPAVLWFPKLLMYAEDKD